MTTQPEAILEYKSKPQAFLFILPIYYKLDIPGIEEHQISYG